MIRDLRGDVGGKKRWQNQTQPRFVITKPNSIHEMREGAPWTLRIWEGWAHDQCKVVPARTWTPDGATGGFTKRAAFVLDPGLDVSHGQACVSSGTPGPQPGHTGSCHTPRRTRELESFYLFAKDLKNTPCSKWADLEMAAAFCTLAKCLKATWDIGNPPPSPFPSSGKPVFLSINKKFVFLHLCEVICWSSICLNQALFVLGGDTYIPVSFLSSIRIID